MAEIIDCLVTSDSTSLVDGCKTNSGVAAIYQTKYNFLTFSAANVDNASHTIKALPVIANGATNNKLVKLDIDIDTIRYTSETTNNGASYKETLEFNTNGMNAAKAKNYRSLASCCGVVYFIVLNSGVVIATGLDMNQSGVTIAKTPMKNTLYKFDTGLGSEEQGNIETTWKWEGESKFGFLVLDFSTAAADLENAS